MSMSKLLLAGVASAVIGAGGAQAAPTLSYELFDSAVTTNGGLIASGSATNGFLPINVSADGFNIGGTLQGVPGIVSPDLSATSTLTASTTRSFAGNATLTLYISQSGLTNPSGTFPLQTTLDLNNLANAISTNGVTSSISDYVSASNLSFAAAVADPASTLIASLTGVAHQDAQNGENGVTQTVSVGNSTYSETAVLTATYNAGGESLGMGNQIISVPEPMSLALLGSALFGVGMIRRRKRG